MEYIETSIKGVWLIKPERFGDSRGYFAETFRLGEFRRVTGLPDIEFVQDNESYSSRGVLRGLHLQRGSFSQAKLVRVSAGRVLDVAVDLRPGSPTFGKHVSVELSADNGLQLFIPRWFAHGFQVLSDTAQFQYKVDNVYAPGAELSLRFDDPDVAVEWAIAPAESLLSPKDLCGLPLRDVAPLVATDPKNDN